VFYDYLPVCLHSPHSHRERNVATRETEFDCVFLYSTVQPANCYVITLLRNHHNEYSCIAMLLNHCSEYSYTVTLICSAGLGMGTVFTLLSCHSSEYSYIATLVSTSELSVVTYPRFKVPLG